MQLTKPVHEFNDCVRIWAGFRVTVTDDMFCKSAFDSRDTCDGDSGSPLVTGQGANRLQVGIVRWVDESPFLVLINNYGNSNN